MVMSNLTTFHGKTIKDFSHAGDLTINAGACPRIRIDWDSDEESQDVLERLLSQPNANQLEALVIGSWSGDDSEGAPDEVIKLLASSGDRLPNLKALFIGDISADENEISWIHQGDMSSLWATYPKLEEFGARGGNDLRLGPLNHSALKKIVIQTGGMSAELLGEALAIKAQIEHFEVWLGSENYGASTNVDHFASLFAGELFPNLKVLALRNCEYADDLAERVATAPIMDRISELDLSKGTLTDRGAKALSAGGKLGALDRLVIDHHYLTDAGLAELRLSTKMLIEGKQLKPDSYGGEEHYYIAVSE